MIASISSALCWKDTALPARLGNSVTVRSTRAEGVKNLAYTCFVCGGGAYDLRPAYLWAQPQRCVSKIQGPSNHVGDWVQRVFELIIVKFSYREKSLGITSLELSLISENLSRAGSLKLLDKALLWGCSGHCRMFGNIPSFYPRHANGSTLLLPAMTVKFVFRHHQTFHREQKCAQLRTTGLERSNSHVHLENET